MSDNSNNSSNNIEPQGPKDWFLGRTQGELVGNYADIQNQVGSNVDLKSDVDYWNTPEIRANYEKQYGDKAVDKFNEHYQLLSKDYVNYLEENYDKTAVTQELKLTNYGVNNNKPLAKGTAVAKVGIVNTMNFGQIELFGEYTDMLYSGKEKAKMVQKYEKDGEIFDIPLGEDGEPDLDYLYNLKSEDGRDVVNILYPDAINNPEGRDTMALKLVYEGEYAKTAGGQSVNTWDFTGYKFREDIGEDLEAGVFDFIPRTATNFVLGFGEMAMYPTTQLAIGLDSLYQLGDYLTGNGDAFDKPGFLTSWVEDNVLTQLHRLEYTQSYETQQNPFSSWDGLAGLGLDVIFQFMTGKIVGTAAMKGAKLLRFGLNKFMQPGGKAALKALSYTQAEADLAAKASSWAMTLYAGSDMYDSALANGFNRQEASLIYLTNLFALKGLTTKLNNVEHTFEAVKQAKAVKLALSKTAVFTKKALDNIEKQVTGGVITRAAGNKAREYVGLKWIEKALKPIGNTIGTVLSKEATGLVSDIAKEGVEEGLEFITSETVKHAANAYVSAVKGRDNVKEGEGRFKDMFDKGYWDDFRAELGGSMLGGAIGGGVIGAGKLFFKSGQTSVDYKKGLISAIGQGQGEQWLKAIDRRFEEESKSELGKVSIEYDEVAKRYKSVGEAGPNAISMAEANKIVALQEYNYVSTLLEGLGLNTKAGFNVEATLAKYKGLEGIVDGTTLKKDVDKISSHYVKIASDFDAETAKIVGISPEDRAAMGEEAYQKEVQKSAEANNLSVEVASKLMELKGQMDDILNGKASEKYLLQGVQKNTVFKELSAKYGDDFLKNLLIMTKKSADNYKDLHAKATEASVEAAKEINKLKPDLSNIDDVIDSLVKSGNLYLNDESKEKLESILKEFNEGTAKDLDSMKKDLIESVVDQVYSQKEIAKLSDEFNDIEPGLKDRYLQFAEAFFKKRMELKITKAADTSSVANLAFEHPKYLNFKIALNNSEDFPGTDLIGLLQDGNIDTDALIKKAEEFAADESIQASESVPLSSIDRPEVDDILDKVRAVKKLNEMQNELDYLGALDESRYNHLITSFSGTEELEEGASLGSLFDGVKAAFDATKLPGSEDYYYEDAEGLENLIEKLKVRRDLADLLIGQSDFKEGLATTLATLTARTVKLNNKDNKDLSSDKIMELVEEDYNNGAYTKLFTSASINVPRYVNLTIKEKQNTITAEEKEELAELNRTLGGIQGVSKVFTGYIEKAEFMLEKTRESLARGGMEENFKKSSLESLQHESDILGSMVNSLESKIGSDVISSSAEFVELKAAELAITAHNITEDGLIRFFQAVQNVKQAFYKLDDASKAIIEEVLKEPVTAIKSNTARNQAKDLSSSGKDRFFYALSVLYSDHNDFFLQYKNIFGELDSEGYPRLGLANNSQEYVALMVYAMAKSKKIGQAFASLYNKPLKGLEDIVYVDGLQGTGKSFYAFSTAVKIILNSNDSDPNIDNFGDGVLLASNSQAQLANLEEAAKNFGITVNDKFTSKETSSGFVAEDLIKALEKASKEDVSTTDFKSSIIVFDEATLLAADELDNSRDYSSKSDLGKILDLISEINKKRTAYNSSATKGKLPLLTMVALGDHNQNGHMAKDTASNIGAYRNNFPTTMQLTISMRTDISHITEFNAKLLEEAEKAKMSAGVTVSPIEKLEGTYAKIAGQKKRGGVQLITDRADNKLMTDEEATNLVEHLKEVIDEDPALTIGLIGITPDELNTQPILAEFVVKYAANIKKSDITHKGAQGAEFDYVIAKFGKNDIGSSTSSKPSIESANTKMVSTTIGRAKFLSFVINKTERNWTSSMSLDEVYLRSKAEKKEIVKANNELKMKMIGDIAVTHTSSTATSPAAPTPPAPASPTGPSAGPTPPGSSSSGGSGSSAGTTTSSSSTASSTSASTTTSPTTMDLAILNAVGDIQERLKRINKDVDLSQAAQDEVIAKLEATYQDVLVKSVDEGNAADTAEKLKELSRAGKTAEEIKKAFEDYCETKYGDGFRKLKKTHEENKLKIAQAFDEARAQKELEDNPVPTVEVNESAEEDSALSGNSVEDDLDNPEQVTLESVPSEPINSEKGENLKIDLSKALEATTEEELTEIKDNLKQKIDDQRAQEILEEAGFLAFDTTAKGYLDKNSVQQAEGNLPNGFYLKPGISPEEYQAEIREVLKNPGDNEFFLYSTLNGGYKLVAVIARNKSTNNSVIVGQWTGAKIAMGKAEKGEEIRSKDVLASLALNPKVNGGNADHALIPISQDVLNLKNLSQGSVQDKSGTNFSLSEFLDHMSKTQPHIKIAPRVYFSTAATLPDGSKNPFAGDAFLIYSHSVNDVDLTDEQVLEFIAKNGLTKYSNPAFKGFKGVGVIRLNNVGANWGNIIDKVKQSFDDSADQESREEIENLIKLTTNTSRNYFGEVLGVIYDKLGGIVPSEFYDRYGIPTTGGETQKGGETLATAVGKVLAILTDSERAAMGDYLAKILAPTALGEITTNEEGVEVVSKGAVFTIVDGKPPMVNLLRFFSHLNAHPGLAEAFKKVLSNESLGRYSKLYQRHSIAKTEGASALPFAPAKQRIEDMGSDFEVNVESIREPQMRVSIDSLMNAIDEVVNPKVEEVSFGELTPLVTTTDTTTNYSSMSDEDLNNLQEDILSGDVSLTEAEITALTEEIERRANSGNAQNNAYDSTLTSIAEDVDKLTDPNTQQEISEFLSEVVDKVKPFVVTPGSLSELKAIIDNFFNVQLTKGVDTDIIASIAQKAAGELSSAVASEVVQDDEFYYNNLNARVEQIKNMDITDLPATDSISKDSLMGRLIEYHRVKSEATQTRDNNNDDLANQKADIEQRREEELGSMESRSFTDDEGNTNEVILKEDKNGKTVYFRKYDKEGNFLGQHEATYKKELSNEDIYKLHNADEYTYTPVRKLKVEGKRADKINAKYDAELAKLGGGTNTVTGVSNLKLSDVSIKGFKISNSADLNKVLVSKDGNSIFTAMGRTFVLANVNGTIIPYYQSSAGTSGKIKGDWYPFFGYTGNWLVKGAVDKATGAMSYSPKIDEVGKLLNDNFKLPLDFDTKGKSESSNLSVEDFGLKTLSVFDRFKFDTVFIDGRSQSADRLFVAELTGLNPEYVANDGKGSAAKWVNAIINKVESNNAELKSENTSPSVDTTTSIPANSLLAIEDEIREKFLTPSTATTEKSDSEILEDLLQTPPATFEGLKDLMDAHFKLDLTSEESARALKIFDKWGENLMLLEAAEVSINKNGEISEELKAELLENLPEEWMKLIEASENEDLSGELEGELSELINSTLKSIKDLVSLSQVESLQSLEKLKTTLKTEYDKAESILSSYEAVLWGTGATDDLINSAYDELEAQYDLATNNLKSLEAKAINQMNESIVSEFSKEVQDALNDSPELLSLIVSSSRSDLNETEALELDNNLFDYVLDGKLSESAFSEISDYITTKRSKC